MKNTSNRLEQNTIFYLNMGSLIYKYRQLNNLTQEELGNKIGISRIAIHNIESGKRRLAIHSLNDICNILGCTISDIISSESCPNCNAGSFNGNHCFDCGSEFNV